MANYLILLILTISAPVFARFNDQDAQVIDREELNNTESWNDKNSYRYPITWEDAWRKTDVGYRVNAGSLNVSRFNFDDDIRIAPRPFDTFTASFTQSRREDFIEKNLDREIRAGWSMIPHRRLSVLGDTDTFKEYGDLGAALTLWEDPDQHTEVYYWSVDHYYKSKKSDDEAFRAKDSKTIGVNSSNLSDHTPIHWSLRHEVDTPLDWTHPSAGYRYEYARSRSEARVDTPIIKNTDHQLIAYTLWNHEWKYESKNALLPLADNKIFKTMRRHNYTWEIGTQLRLTNNGVYAAAIQYLRRDVDYTNGDLRYTGPLWQESVAPSSVRRREGAALLTAYLPMNQWFAVQHGVFINKVRVSEDKRIWGTTETKYQALFDFTFNETTKFALNTTWDIDQIARDYPYSKESPFRPWGGGDLQFLMRI